MSKIANHLHKKFGRLTVIEYLGVKLQARKTKAQWKAICECGNYWNGSGNSLQSGKAKSCGCLALELNVCIKSHEEYHHSKEYNTWVKIKQRCYNIKSKDYSNYGGRGIKVSREWLGSFSTFLMDMGRSPTKTHTIDRINVNEGYSKENCRWATRLDQCNNQRKNILIEYNNETLTLSQLSEKLGIAYYNVRQSYKRGFTAKDMIDRYITKKI